MLKVLELFAGIGACSKALERLGISHEIVDAVEIDKYAIESFNAIHNTNFEPQDITKWDKDLDVDLIMHGSPCQDFSVAGKGAGGDEGTGTRSSLMYETIRIVEKLKPQYVIWENVKNVLSKKHKHNFDNYINRLEELGYNSYYQVLNSKDYGIPQNRERVFTISILKEKIIYDDYNSKIREDQDTIGVLTCNCGSSAVRNGWKIIECNQDFNFPSKEKLELKLKDMLEDEVDEKYYLSDVQIDRIKATNYVSGGYIQRVRQLDGICNTLAARDWKDPKCVQIGNLQGGKWDKINESCRRVYDEKGISPTIHTCQGGNTEPKVATMKIKNATKKGYQEASEGDSINLAYPGSETRRGRVGKEVSQTLTANDSMGIVLKYVGSIKDKDIVGDNKNLSRNSSIGDRVYDNNGLATTQSAVGGGKGGNTGLYTDGLRIRKLTPLECWRLQGFDDEDFYKAKEKLNNTFYKGRDKSNSQLYKQAGNSITVNVLEKIFLNLF